MNFIRVKFKLNELVMLLDTGASVSIIFESMIPENQKINKTKKIKLNGISGSTMALGSTILRLELGDRIIEHEFYVVEDFECKMHGILGADFFMAYAAVVNYKTSEFTYKINNRNKFVQIESDFNNYTIVPPRCEVIKYFPINNCNDCVILPEEVCTGVFIAGMIARPNQNLIPVKFLNCNDKEIKIKNFIPKTENLSKFDVCEFNNPIFSVDRVEKLLKLLNTDGLTREEKLSIDKICAKYADVFCLENDSLTVTNICKHKIQLQEGATPTYVKPYRLPYAQKQEINEQISKMLNDGIIEPAVSEWSSPLLIVPKKGDASGNKKWRVVIDFRLVNKQLRDDKFPLPCIDQILDSLSGAMYFSHLDLSQGYYQIELEPNSRRYTAFSTDRGQFQMTRLPMGLKISPSVFSRAMTIAMTGLNYEKCFVYLDDLIVFGNNLNIHNINLSKVLARLRKVNLKLNPSKCEFLKKEILYLGHVISSEGILPDPEKIRCVKNYPVPESSAEVKRFVAFANYYRKFVKNFAQLAAPLNQLTRKGVIFQWNNNCQKAFETLKQALITPPILQYPDFSETNQFILRTDASAYAVGAVLSNSNDKPVAYASRTLNKAEINYCTIEKELLAICWGVTKFRPYLYGKKFQILTDHKPLVYLFGMTNPSSRLTKFRLTLEEYDFTVTYVKGTENVTADALSRIQIDSNELKELSSKTCETINVLTRAQKKRNDNSNEDSNSATFDDRSDHPGIVELLKAPEEAIELNPVTEEQFNKVLKYKSRDNYYCNKCENIIYDMSSNIIYIKQEPRSSSTSGVSVRDLIYICKKFKIREAVILKNEKCALLIKEILKASNKLKENGIKISIIKCSKHITNKETQQLIINDFHMLPTGGHAGINRTYNNIKKRYY